MQRKAQRFDPRQNMNRKNYEIFHYLDIKTRHVDAHYHDFYEIYFFIAGEVDYWIDGSLYHLKSGDVLLINPLELHRTVVKEKSEEYERIVLWVDKEFLKTLFENSDECFDVKRENYKKIIRPSVEEREELFNLFETMVREFYSKEYKSEIYSYAALIQIMAFLNRLSFGESSVETKSLATPTLIADVMEYIGEHFNEELSLDSLAKRFFISKYHLSHEFTKAVGTSVHRYQTLKRLNNAYEMLKSGVSAQEVSVKCGFSDYTSFFRAFKTEYSVSPRTILVEGKNLN